VVRSGLFRRSGGYLDPAGRAFPYIRVISVCCAAEVPEVRRSGRCFCPRLFDINRRRFTLDDHRWLVIPGRREVPGAPYRAEHDARAPPVHIDPMIRQRVGRMRKTKQYQKEGGEYRSHERNRGMSHQLILDLFWLGGYGGCVTDCNPAQQGTVLLACGILRRYQGGKNGGMAVKIDRDTGLCLNRVPRLRG
jgi:hypothetical protein